MSQIQNVLPLNLLLSLKPADLAVWKGNAEEVKAAAAKSHQSCPTLCDPIDSSPPVSSVPGILQARTLEWVAISFSNEVKEIKDKLELCLSLFASNFDDAGDLWSKLMLSIVNMHLHLAHDFH